MWYGKNECPDGCCCCSSDAEQQTVVDEINPINDQPGGQKLESILPPVSGDLKGEYEKYLENPLEYSGAYAAGIDAEVRVPLVSLAEELLLFKTMKDRMWAEKKAKEDPVKVLSEIGVDLEKMAKLAGVKAPEIPKCVAPEWTPLIAVTDAIKTLKSLGVSADKAAEIAMRLLEIRLGN